MRGSVVVCIYQTQEWRLREQDWTVSWERKGFREPNHNPVGGVSAVPASGPPDLGRTVFVPLHHGTCRASPGWGFVLW